MTNAGNLEGRKLLPIIQEDEGYLEPSFLEEVVIIGHGATRDDFWKENHRSIEIQEKRKKGTLEVWGLNHTAFVYKVDKVFNMHDLEMLKICEPHWPYIDFYERYLPDDIPLVTVKSIPTIPQSVRYPLELVIQEFESTYFSSGLPYLIAYALLCNVQRISFYGCDFEYPGRNAYEVGRGCVEYWLGIGKQYNGLEVSFPLESTMMDVRWRLGERPAGRFGYGKLYGYWDRYPIIISGGYVSHFNEPDQGMEDAFADPEGFQNGDNTLGDKE